MVHICAYDVLVLKGILRSLSSLQANELQSIDDDYREQYQHKKLLGRGVIVSHVIVVVSGDWRERFFLFSVIVVVCDSVDSANIDLLLRANIT